MIKPQAFYAEKIADLLNAPAELDHFSTAFSGPSIDLHLWALDARPTLFDPTEATASLRAVYSVLVAWGMHRMGPNGATMPRFADFERSVLETAPDIQGLWNANAPLDESQWQALERVFRAMRATTSGSPIVANSKALFHLLPNIVVPIDREYTMRFLGLHSWYQSKRTSADASWSLFRELHEHFFHPALRSDHFQRLTPWAHDMCSRPTKFLDNLIVSKVRSEAP